MAQDMLEQLAHSSPPPPPPAAIVEGLHERLNKSLLVGQIVDLAIHGLPIALACFAHALVGLISMTLTGEYPRQEERKEPRQESP